MVQTATYQLLSVAGVGALQYYAQFPPFLPQTQLGKVAFALLTGIAVAPMLFQDYVGYEKAVANKASINYRAALDLNLLALAPFAAGAAAVVYFAQGQSDAAKIAVLLGVDWVVAKAMAQTSIIALAKNEYAILKSDM